MLAPSTSNFPASNDGATALVATTKGKSISPNKSNTKNEGREGEPCGCCSCCLMQMRRMQATISHHQPSTGTYTEVEVLA